MSSTETSDISGPSPIMRASLEVLDAIFGFLDVALANEPQPLFTALFVIPDSTVYYRKPIESYSDHAKHKCRSLDFSGELSSYTTVCKAWACLLERRTFSYLTLTACRCHEARNIMTRSRLAYVRAIDIKIHYLLRPPVDHVFTSENRLYGADTLRVAFTLLNSWGQNVHGLSLRVLTREIHIHPGPRPSKLKTVLPLRLPTVTSVEQLVLGSSQRADLSWDMLPNEYAMEIIQALPSVKRLAYTIWSDYLEMTERVRAIRVAKEIFFNLPKSIDDVQFQCLDGRFNTSFHPVPFWPSMSVDYGLIPVLNKTCRQSRIFTLLGPVGLSFLSEPSLSPSTDWQRLEQLYLTIGRSVGEGHQVPHNGPSSEGEERMHSLVASIVAAMKHMPVLKDMEIHTFIEVGAPREYILDNQFSFEFHVRCSQATASYTAAKEFKPKPEVTELLNLIARDRRLTIESKFISKMP